MNIQIFSDNEDFKKDLSAQIVRFADKSVVTDEAPDVIIVDEDENIYSRKRTEYPSVPILFLTSEVCENEGNLNVVVQKPLNLMRFLDIVRAVNNKLDSSADGFLVFNNYELHPNQKEIVDLKNNKTIKLTEKEIGIIKYLYKRGSEYVGKGDLQTNVWQYSSGVTTHTVETHIYRLRQKVESDERRLIITDNGKYKLNMG
ncbi:MAG: response regulator transcription factor [Alphaproteobacteria bacterium]|nr:response regulator transcription factor [Alphaproteobacteria bacterium]